MTTGGTTGSRTRGGSAGPGFGVGTVDAAVTDGRLLRGRRTRERLVEAASGLFAAAGFDETTMDDIALRAGVTRQTVFNHFPRKEDFAFAWGARQRERLHELIVEELRSRGAEAQLHAIMRVMGEDYERAGAEARVLLLAWVRAGGPVVEDPALLGEQLAAIVQTGQQSGEFRADTDPSDVARVVRALYLDAVYRWVAAGARPQPTTLTQDMSSGLEVVLRGLRQPADAPL